ncbi:CD99 molecule isoform X2 [Hoplias malabaricus]|uniref:CD99 molecule isoform X2 n=1 Tax=Hoplias malabaricus TaxID=27720 RepID=UPI003462D982
MTSYLWILVLASLAGTRAQDFDLSAALDPDPTPEPEKKPPKSGGDGLLDLGDALGPDTPSEPSKPAGNPSKSGDPNKPADPPKSEGGEFSLNDAVSGDYKPDPSGGGGARSGGEGQPYDTQGDEGQSQELDHQWLKVLNLLVDNIPEGLHSWIANSKHIVMSLVEKVLELVEVAGGEKQS